MTRENLSTLAAAKKRIDDILDSSHEDRVYAVFDFDNTCIHHDIGEAVLAHLCRKKLLRSNALLPDLNPVSKEEYAHALFHHYWRLTDSGEKERAYLVAAGALAGYRADALDGIVRETLKYEGDILGKTDLFGRKIAKGLRAKEAARMILEYLARKGVKCWIVSASLQGLVQAMVSRLFGDFDLHVIGVRMEESSRVLGTKVLSPAPMFGGKVDCIKTYIDPTVRPILVAGDSEGDLAMLEYAQIRIVIDVGSPLARRIRDNKPKDWYVL